MERWPLRGKALAEIFFSYLGIVLFGLVLGWLIRGPASTSPVVEFDIENAHWWETLRNPDLTQLSEFGSSMGDTITIVGGLLLLTFVFTWVWKRWRESLTLGLSLFLEATTFVTISLIVGRDRPPIEQLDVSPPTASFPSGHTGAAFAFYTALAVIVFWNTKKPITRLLSGLIAVVVPFAVAVARMYRGMHHLTDVLAGALFGLVCLFLAIGIVRRARKRAAL